MFAIRWILSRNIICFALICLLMGLMLNWPQCVLERGRYLLGIYYNGFFKNEADGQVYQEYLKRHGYTHESFSRLIGFQ